MNFTKVVSFATLLVVLALAPVSDSHLMLFKKGLIGGKIFAKKGLMFAPLLIPAKVAAVKAGLIGGVVGGKIGAKVGSVSKLPLSVVGKALPLLSKPTYKAPVQVLSAPVIPAPVYRAPLVAPLPPPAPIIKSTYAAPVQTFNTGY